jgi:hypothetical protein
LSARLLLFALLFVALLAQQERLLARHTPTVAGKRTASTHHAMARHQQRNRVCSARLRHGTHRARPPRAAEAAAPSTPSPKGQSEND